MATRWDTFVYWASRFYKDLDDFDANERTYKLKSAEKAANVRQLFESGSSDWLEHVKSPLGVNLCNRFAIMEFGRWVESESSSLAAGLRSLWNPLLFPSERIDGFLENIPSALKRSALAEPALVLHSAMGIEQYPSYRVGKINEAFQLTGYPSFADAEIKADYGLRYAHVLGFFDRILSEASLRRFQLRDRLDAQSVTWSVTYWPPLDGWTDDEKAAFLAYQKSAAT